MTLSSSNSVAFAIPKAKSRKGLAWWGDHLLRPMKTNKETRKTIQVRFETISAHFEKALSKHSYTLIWNFKHIGSLFINTDLKVKTAFILAGIAVL